VQGYHLVGITEGHVAIQRDLSRLEKQVDGNFKQFNKGKCQILHLGRNHPSHPYMLGADQMESIWAENTLGILVDNKLSMRHSHALWCQQVKGRDPSPLLCSGEVIIGELHFWAPQYNRGETPTKGHEDDQGTGASLL